MKVLDPGHLYQLDVLDGIDPEILCFVKRIGDKFPGNTPPGYKGTTSQEVIRALLDRAHYVNNQVRSAFNEDVIYHLTEALRWLEVRAAVRRSDQEAVNIIANMPHPELAETCPWCGHIHCSVDHKAKP